MGIKLVWDGQKRRDDMRLLGMISRHRRLIASIERLSKTTCEGEGGIAALRLASLFKEERQVLSELSAMPVANEKDIYAKAAYFVELLEQDEEGCETADVIAAMRSIAAYFKVG